MKARYLALYKETAAGEFPTGTPTPVLPRLIGDDAFSLLAAPQFAEITSMEANNRPIDQETSRIAFQGKLSTYLYPDQSDEFFDWALTLDPTTGELPSYSAQYFDGKVYRQILGVYISQLQLQASATSDEGIMKLSLDLVALKPGATIDGTSFPVPAYTDYQTGSYKLTHTKGGLILATSGTTARTKYDSLTLTIKNNLSVNWDEDQYATDITFHGRHATLEGNFRYIDNSDRALFEGNTKLKCSLKMEKGTTPAKKTLTVDLLGNCKIGQLDRSQPMAKPGYNKITIRSFLDPATTPANDITAALVTS